jgi:hypothetical protein
MKGLITLLNSLKLILFENKLFVKLIDIFKIRQLSNGFFEIAYEIILVFLET